MADNLNFKAVVLRLFNNKNLNKNGFDTIEIDLVLTLCGVRGGALKDHQAAILKVRARHYLQQIL